MTDLAERERAVIALLDEWPWDWGGCVIGGYAVAAYGPPRYSGDVDFVIPAETETNYTDWLRETGFRKVERKPGSHAPFASAQRLVRAPIFLDLMIGRVRDRTSKAEIPELWISKEPRRVPLDLVRGSTNRPVVVARPEALWALKLLASRDQDLGDLFAISRTRIDVDEVRACFTSIMTPALHEKLAGLPARLNSQKLFADALSRVEGGSPADPANLSAWTAFKAKLLQVVTGPGPRSELD